MSRLSDKMDELERQIDICDLHDFERMIGVFNTEGALTDWFDKDILVYMNESKTECLTVVLVDTYVSVQWIKENEDTSDSRVFFTKHLTFDEMVRIVKTHTRRYKLNKIKNN